MIKIDQFLQANIDSSVPIVVAVSGGPDSMALLSLLESYFKTIICVHVNHNTGRIGQKEEEQFVKEYALTHHHKFETMTIETYRNNNFHDEAHRIRYQFFEKILKKYHSSYLFTAHHGDDLMETMIFRMMRGSSIQSFHGFSKISKQKDYFIVRPLLEYTKNQLLQYNEINHIPYCIDSSNASDVYTRNRIRKYILPFMKSENKNVHLKFLNLSNELQELENYVQRQMASEFNKRFQNNVLDIANWKKIESLIQKRIIMSMLSIIYRNNQQVLEKKHINMILNMILHSSSGTEIHLPNKKILRKEYDRLEWLTKEENNSYQLEINSDVVLPNGHQIIIKKQEETDSNFVCRLSKKDVAFPLIVRTRKAHDAIEVKGLGHAKKIKEIFINEKVPLHLRQSWPIVTDKNGKVVWIPGLKKSKFDKTKEEKYDIILKYYLRRESLNE